MSDAASDAYKEEMMENQYLEVVQLQRRMGYPEPIKKSWFFAQSHPERMKIIHDVQKEYLLWEAKKKNEALEKEDKETDNDSELTNQFKTWFPNVDK